VVAGGSGLPLRLQWTLGHWPLAPSEDGFGVRREAVEIRVSGQESTNEKGEYEEIS
jgi:hypothetical protein